MSDLLSRVRSQVQHAAEHKMEAVAIDVVDVQQLLDDLRDAEQYIAQLRAPLLWEFGTTEPDLLMELFQDRGATA